jgi:hypothetical protein
MSSYTVSLWDLSGLSWSCHPSKNARFAGAYWRWMGLKAGSVMLTCPQTEQPHGGFIGLLRGQLATGRCT